jgi:hypothetical protein
MPRVKPTIFTIHGIYTEGAWQSGAAAVLDPFFQHHPLKYEEYRRGAGFPPFSAMNPSRLFGDGRICPLARYFALFFAAMVRTG